jgi:hypothetical protein
MSEREYFREIDAGLMHSLLNKPGFSTGVKS